MKAQRWCWTHIAKKAVAAPLRPFCSFIPAYSEPQLSVQCVSHMKVQRPMPMEHWMEVFPAQYECYSLLMGSEFSFSSGYLLSSFLLSCPVPVLRRAWRLKTDFPGSQNWTKAIISASHRLALKEAEGIAAARRKQEQMQMQASAPVRILSIGVPAEQLNMHATFVHVFSAGSRQKLNLLYHKRLAFVLSAALLQGRPQQC
eukprot:850593-Pelagomonas_calceolata.AAC.3